MNAKRTLIKQKATFGSVDDRNSSNSDEQFDGNETITKQGRFKTRELSTSDSDEENSLGKINRTSSRKAVDSLDELFRDTSEGKNEGIKMLAKGASNKEKGEAISTAKSHPIASPRRNHLESQSASSKQQKSSYEDDEGLASAIGHFISKEEEGLQRPVVPPRISPRRHQGKSSSPLATTPTALARERPGLAKYEGKIKSFDKDLGDDENEWRKTREEGVRFESKVNENVADKPSIPARRRKRIELDDLADSEISARLNLHDSQYENTRRETVEKPEAFSRRKRSDRDFLEKGDDDEENKYERMNSLQEKPKAPSRSRRGSGEKMEREEIDEILKYEPVAASRRKGTFSTEDHGQQEFTTKGMEYESLSERHIVPSRRKNTYEETNEKQNGEDGRTYDYKRTEVSSGKPEALLRSKNTLDEESGEDDVIGNDYKRSNDFVSKPTAPSKRKQTTTLQEEHSRPQNPIIRTSTYDDDHDGAIFEKDQLNLEHVGNLRHGGRAGKVKGRPVVSVARSDSSEEITDEEDLARELNNYDLSDGRRYGSGKRYDTEDRDSQEKYAEQTKGKSVRATVDDILKEHSKKLPTEGDGNDVAKRPGSAPAMKRASSLETMSSAKGSLTKKGVSEDRPQKVKLKKSLTPQRPMSGKKGSLLAQLRQKAHGELTADFEEHVPPVENVISTGTEDGRSTKKGAFDTGVSGTRRESKSQRSSPLRANQGIETMTRSPHSREEQREVWADARGTPPRGVVTPKRASSLTNLRASSPDAWEGDSSGRGSQRSGPLDTASIRQAVFEDWRSKKSAKLKEQLNQKSAEKKKLEDKELEERERKKVAQRAFESWNETKHEKNKQANAKKKEMMEKELEKQTEKNIRAREAVKYFETWKTRKDEELKEQHVKKKQERKEKKTKEIEESQDKKKFSQKAFENWKSNKDKKIKEEIQKKRKQENEGKMKEEDEKYERSIQCAERFQEWVEKKGKARKCPPPPTLTQRSWCPSGRTSGNFIPQKVGDVILKPAPNRSRTMSGSYYFN